MRAIRKRLTYANVMSTLSVFLVLTGATAFAATQLAKNSVGTKQLKKNAVTTAKLKKNAVATAKIRKGAVNAARLKKNAVTTAKLKKNAVTGAKIDAGTTPFSRVTARLRTATSTPFGGKTPISLGSYEQPAGEVDQYLGEVTVNFDPGCTAPRSAITYLVADPADPNNPLTTEIAGVAVVNDETGATGTHTAVFVPFFEGGFGMQSLEQETARTHTFYAYALKENCTAGSGVTASNFALDVIGTK